MPYSEYVPPLILRNGHLATMYPALFRAQDNPFDERQRIVTSDDDFFDVDCIRHGNKALVVLLHGLEGSSSSQYILSAARLLSQNGYDIAAMNYRSCSGEVNKQARVYYAGCTDDVEALVEHFSPSYDAVYVVGYSLGGNIAMNYAGGFNCAITAKLKGVMGISMPIDLEACTLQIQRLQNRLYEKRFVISLKEKARMKTAQYPEFYTEEKLSRVKTLFDFDDLFTGPANGYADGHAYYQDCSSKLRLPEIQVPACIINAENDPFLPQDSYDELRSFANAYLNVIVTKYGGHVGFSNFGAKHYWIDYAILDFLKS